MGGDLSLARVPDAPRSGVLSAAPLVSIVIPTRNGGARLRQLFAAIASQRTDFQTEVVAVDSASSDGTTDFLAARVTQLIQIDPRSFDHGTTRNLAVSKTRGTFVVLMVQDAVPVDDRWLAALVDPLRRDPRLAATFARQVPTEDASPLTRHYLARWIAAGPDPRAVFVHSETEFAALSPIERFERSVLDNVCAAIRRSVWTAIPFRSTPIAEDVEWGREALLAGHGLAYVPDAIVEHSHDRSAWYELKRTWVLHQQLHRLFGLRTVPTAGRLARAVGGSLMLHRRELSKAHAPLTAYLRGAALAVAWPVGQYVGGWTAASGRFDWRPRGV
jgi:rhamnosyltransferase